MEIKRLNFEKVEVEIRETYLDENGLTRERVRTVLVPTGRVLRDDETSASDDKEEK
ncbi:MAG: hypothetical protein IKK75_13200 [Clostridia bacterium]|nr:hypothetical protein [Clostridia bacterium]